MNKFSFKGLADQARSAGTKLASAGGFEQLQGLQAFRRTGVVRSTLHTSISCSAFARAVKVLADGPIWACFTPAEDSVPGLDSAALAQLPPQEALIVLQEQNAQLRAALQTERQKVGLLT